MIMMICRVDAGENENVQVDTMPTELDDSM
jgi:hypothetical protein